MISQESIDEVRRKASIDEVIGEFVELQRRGSTTVGLCPFHSEKTPSFSVNPERGFYHCFGCGESGNAFTFLMKMEGVSFPDAVQSLAERFGVELRYSGRQTPSTQKNDTRKLYKVNALAYRFFRAQLTSAPLEVSQYIEQRGLGADVLERFGVGFAPNDWRELTAALRESGAPDELIVRSGLARRSSRGDLYDTFRGRVVFPVFVGEKQIAGFGGRIVPSYEEADNKSPKYLNSPETEVYQKSRILFGVPQARAALRQSKEVYLAEGYMDVLGLWQVGVQNALATCGTAVTRQHVERLSHLVKRVFVLFDGDSAGRAAAGKCFDLFINSGVDVHALFLPDGEDPDSIARTHGESSLSYLQSVKPTTLLNCYLQSELASFGVQRASELGTASKGKLAEKVVKILRQVNSAVEQRALVQEAAFELLIPEETLFRELDGANEKETFTPTPVDREPVEEFDRLDSVPSIAELPRIDQTVLRSVMAYRETYPQRVLSDAELCYGLQQWTLTFIEGVRGVVQASGDPGQQRARIKALLKSFGPSWLKHWKETYRMLEDSDVDLERSFEECRLLMERAKLSNALSELELNIRECKDDSLAEELAQERLMLQRRLQQLG